MGYITLVVVSHSMTSQTTVHLLNILDCHFGSLLILGTRCNLYEKDLVLFCSSQIPSINPPFFFQLSFLSIRLFSYFPLLSFLLSSPLSCSFQM